MDTTVTPPGWLFWVIIGGALTVPNVVTWGGPPEILFLTWFVAPPWNPPATVEYIAPNANLRTAIGSVVEPFGPLSI